MPKVSKNPISRETEHQIFNTLIKTFVKIDNEAMVKLFLDDLLTPTEKLMVAKRLMVAVLLQRGYAPSAICALLKMSKVTVNGIRRDILKHGDGYKMVFRNFFKEAGVVQFMKSADKWLDALRLPIKGSKGDLQRWKKALNRV